MPVAPTPRDIYERAVVEGERRLAASPLELVATGFNAGFTVVFGVAALGIVHGFTAASVGTGMARVLGAAAFGIGLAFLVVSRSELFSENFFDPVATVIERPSRSRVARLVRLWVVVLVVNLVGAALLVALLAIDGVMPAAADEPLRSAAEDILAKGADAAFVNAVVGGALVTLLSFLLQAVDQVLSRIVLALLVGFLLAVAPFAHVAVTAAHLLFPLFDGGHVTGLDVLVEIAMATAGNLVGGLGFVTLSHVAQARAEPG